MKKGELITNINGIDFFYGGLNECTGWELIYTNDENYHIPKNSNFENECKRIYILNYE